MAGRAPTFPADAFARAFTRLLPTGPIWSVEEDSPLYLIVRALVLTYVRGTQRAVDLLVDGFPASTKELLPDWEDSLGLPDPCAGENPSVATRRAQVVARFIGSGGPSIAALTAYAASLGYTIQIRQFAQARAGILKAGDPLNGRAWSFAWAIVAPINTITTAKAGALAAGDPLRSWGNEVLECEMAAIKPAHTILIFQYI